MSTRKILRDYGLTILVALLVAWVLRTYVIEAYRIPNSVMKPTLISGDAIFIEKWNFKVNDGYTPKRGDVVVFSTPVVPGGPPVDFIKRVVGLPGDEISIIRGRVILNGKSLASRNSEVETLPEGKTYPLSFAEPLVEDMGPLKVPDKSVFLIGDCRSQLEVKQKKSWGIIPVSALKGKATWLWLSLDHSRVGEAMSWFPRFRLERMFQRIL